MKNFAYIISLLILVPASHGWTQGAGVLKITHRSSFRSVDSLRNPFWPIGYIPGSETPTAAQPAAIPQKALMKPEDFNLTSITSFKGIRMAMLSGKAVGEGESAAINVNGQRVKVQILSVADGAVIVRCMGQDITVPLKRLELDLMAKPPTQETPLHSEEQ